MEAVFGLAGIIIGSVLSWAGVTWSERNKRRHEGRILVRSEKLQAYSSFTSAAKAYVALLYSVAAYVGIDEQTEKLSVEQSTGLLDEAFRARDRAFEQILLVGSDEIIASARSWVQFIYLMRNYLDSPKTSRADWVTHVDRANDARSAFYAQARKELALA